MSNNPNLAKKIYKFGGKSKKKLNSAEFMEFVFFKSNVWWSWLLTDARHYEIYLYLAYFKSDLFRIKLYAFYFQLNA